MDGLCLFQANLADKLNTISRSRLVSRLEAPQSALCSSRRPIDPRREVFLLLINRSRIYERQVFVLTAFHIESILVMGEDKAELEERRLSQELVVRGKWHVDERSD
jgi:hypothetical protein